ncbi:MAG: DUF892 family protein [Bdellovibrionota bacterium]
MSNLENLRDALIAELKDIYSAEQQLVKALPEMEKKAKSPELKKAIRSHLGETQKQVKRLDQAATLLKTKLTGKVCKGMEGLIQEGKEAVKEKSSNEAVIDSLIIGAAQRVEHYEIAAYGTARAMAEELGEDDLVELLSESLSEESDADELLSQISLSSVLPQANGSEAGDDDEDEDEDEDSEDDEEGADDELEGDDEGDDDEDEEDADEELEDDEEDAKRD